MTTDIQAYEAPEGVEIFDPRASSRNAIAVLREHADTMQIAYGLAEKMVNTAMVPKIYQGKENTDNATAAILYGIELGLNPIQSLQQIFTVHGTPAIYARTMVALVLSHGHKVWTVSSSNESVTVAGQRRGGPVTESTWTIERATEAGYVPTIDPKTGKFAVNKYGKLIGNEKYLTDPQAMLYGKAAATICRQIAPDILLGISYSAEDLQSEPSPDSSVVQDREKPKTWEDRLASIGAAEKNETAAEPTIVDVKAAEPTPEPEPASESEPEPETTDATAAVAEPTKTPEPTEENPTVEFVTPARLKALRSALTRSKIDDPNERAAFVKARIGREINAMTELTVDEAEGIIEFIAQGEPAEAGE